MDDMAKKQFRQVLKEAILNLDLSAKRYGYQDEPEYKDLMEHLSQTQRYLMDRPYLTGPGWWGIIDNFLAEARKIDPECEVEGEEKYGELRVHIVSNKTDKKKELHQIKRAMEEAARGVCECCGAPGVIVDLSGWLYTLCSDCAALSSLERREKEDETAEQYLHGKSH